MSYGIVALTLYTRRPFQFVAPAHPERACLTKGGDYTPVIRRLLL